MLSTTPFVKMAVPPALMPLINVLTNAMLLCFTERAYECPGSVSSECVSHKVHITSTVARIADMMLDAGRTSSWKYSTGVKSFGGGISLKATLRMTPVMISTEDRIVDGFNFSPNMIHANHAFQTRVSAPMQALIVWSRNANWPSDRPAPTIISCVLVRQNGVQCILTVHSSFTHTVMPTIQVIRL